MDDGGGHFRQLEQDKVEDMARAVKDLETKHPNHGSWFTVGEIIEIKGSRFRIKNIKPTELRLKLLRKEV